MKRCKNKIRVVLKYCGGCKPTYDRVAAAKRLKRRLKDSVVFLSMSEEPPDTVLIIMGCPTACADLTPFEGLAKQVIRRPEDVDALIQVIAPKRDSEGNIEIGDLHSADHRLR